MPKPATMFLLLLASYWAFFTVFYYLATSLSLGESCGKSLATAVLFAPVFFACLYFVHLVFCTSLRHSFWFSNLLILFVVVSIEYWLGWGKPSTAQRFGHLLWENGRPTIYAIASNAFDGMLFLAASGFAFLAYEWVYKSNANGPK